MKKIILISLLITSILVCVTLCTCGNKSKPIPETEDTRYAREMADEAGLDSEKNPGALVTRRGLGLMRGERVTVVGVLREIGTARFPQLVITPPANFDIHLETKKAQIPNFNELCDTFVEVTGVVSVDALSFGDIARDRFSMTVENLRAAR